MSSLEERAAKYARDQVGMWCDHPDFWRKECTEEGRQSHYSWDRDFTVQMAAYIAGAKNEF